MLITIFIQNIQILKSVIIYTPHTSRVQHSVKNADSNELVSYFVRIF